MNILLAIPVYSGSAVCHTNDMGMNLERAAIEAVDELVDIEADLRAAGNALMANRISEIRRKLDSVIGNQSIPFED